MDLINGYFIAPTQKPTAWFHASLVFHNSSEGITVYHDGNQVATDDSKSPASSDSRDGITVIGRRFSQIDNQYATLIVDELAMWNRAMSEDHVRQIFSKYTT